MTALYDPFIDGDVIWWERGGMPMAFYTRVHGYYVACSENASPNPTTFDNLHNLWHGNATGPYRLAHAENWSAIDFTTPEAKKMHPNYVSFEEELPLAELVRPADHIPAAPSAERIRRTKERLRRSPFVTDDD